MEFITKCHSAHFILVLKKQDDSLSALFFYICYFYRKLQVSNYIFFPRYSHGKAVKGNVNMRFGIADEGKASDLMQQHATVSG